MHQHSILSEILPFFSAAFGGAIGSAVASFLQNRNTHHRALATVDTGLRSFMDQVNDCNPSDLKDKIIGEMRPSVLAAISYLGEKKQAAAYKAWEDLRTLNLSQYGDNACLEQRINETGGGRTDKQNALYQHLKTLRESLENALR